MAESVEAWAEMALVDLAYAKAEIVSAGHEPEARKRAIEHLELAEERIRFISTRYEDDPEPHSKRGEVC